MKKIRVVHYLNQFFAQIGGEDKADVAPEVRDGVIGPGRALQHLRHRKHEVLLFHILAPEEIDFPFDRPTRFKDLERIGQEVRADARRLRAEYRSNFQAHQEELRRKARDLRVDYHLLRTDEPVDRALGAYLAKRRA